MISHILELRPSSRVLRSSTWLLEHARNSTSQFGEDGIIATLFERLGIANRWCVEAGAWDGVHWSNTHDLMRQGWSGVFIEGDDSRFDALQTTYQSNPAAQLLCKAIGLTDAPLGELLANTPIPYDFDLLSLDIDGNDWHVWAALSGYRPRIVVIEFNPSIPNDVVFVQAPDPALNQGCSLLALKQLGLQKGYELAAVTSANAIFVLREEFPALGIGDNSVDAMFHPNLSARIFQGYDGTIFTVGMRMLWRDGAEVPADGLQYLPEQERQYGDSLDAQKSRDRTS